MNALEQSYVMQARCASYEGRLSSLTAQQTRQRQTTKGGHILLLTTNLPQYLIVTVSQKFLQISYLTIQIFLNFGRCGSSTPRDETIGGLIRPTVFQCSSHCFLSSKTPSKCSSSCDRSVCRKQSRLVWEYVESTLGQRSLL